jgi:hypothetical protein
MIVRQAETIPTAAAVFKASCAAVDRSDSGSFPDRTPALLEMATRRTRYRIRITSMD